MGIARGPNIIKDNLVFGYDTGYGVADNNTSTRFYPGEPTTNLKSSNQTSGQIAGMQGVGLTYIGEEGDYSKYSMSGTFSAGTYPYCMYLPGVSFTGGTAYSTQVKLKTNVPHKFNYIGGGINYVNMPQNSAGTNSSVLQADGFNYIKREGFNYVSTTTQAGYIHSNPINNTTFSSSTDFIFIKDFQIEQKSHSTVHTRTSRSSTQSLIDLKRTTDIDVSNVSFDSTGQPEFDGTDDKINLGASSQFNIQRVVTIESVVKRNSSNWNGIFGTTTGGSFIHWQLSGSGLNCYFYGPGLGITKSNEVTDTSKFYHLVVTFDGTTARLYNNGEQVNTATTTSTANITSTSATSIGQVYSTGRMFDGNIPIVKIYNQALTAGEIKQNFNAYKNRFNI